MRDSTIFYRSFYEAISELPEDLQLVVYQSIFDYSLNFNEPDLTGIAKTVFILIKPQLEANNKKFENGKKAKTKQTGSKPEAKDKQTGSKAQGNVNVNVNVNDNVNGKENKNVNIFRKISHLILTNDENKDLLKLGYKQGYINQILDNIENYSENSKYNSLFLTAKNWLIKAYPDTKPLIERVKVEFESGAKQWLTMEQLSDDRKQLEPNDFKIIKHENKQL